MQQQNQKAANFLFTSQVAVLCLLALALRWWNLNSMTFRFDQAEVAFRCMEIWQGKFPWTGITNSLGFRNAPGYTWSLLPAFLLSVSPVVAVAWHGLLSATMIVPMALMGRVLRRGVVGWMPAILAAVHPLSVFAGRNLWAQYLLLPCAAWALFGMVMYFKGDGHRWRWLGLSLGLALWGTSIHFSMAPFAGIILLFGWKAFAEDKGRAWRAMIPAAVIALTMAPAVVDFADSRMNPRKNPDYAAKFEGILPEPLPWFERIRTGMETVFYQQSSDAVSDIAAYWGKWVGVVGVFDGLVVVLLGAGVGGVLKRGIRREEELDEREGLTAKMLLCLLLVPIVFAGILVARVNAGYFPASYPVAWASLLYLPRLNGRAGRWLLAGAAGVMCGGGVLINGYMINTVSREPVISGSYYIPYRLQRETARALVEKGVRYENFAHLSGTWFMRSYEYILRYEMPRSRGENFGLIEDMNLRLGAERVRMLREELTARVESVAIVIREDSDAADAWMARYYDLPSR